MATAHRTRPPPRTKVLATRKKNATFSSDCDYLSSSSSYSSSPEPLVPDHSPPIRLRLKQIQYRSYQRVIQIYHFRTSYLSVYDFRNLLDSADNEYIDTLIGVDTLLENQYIPPGDEVPPNCIEVAYLPGVFPRRKMADGSALGFRVGNGTIEWFCFGRGVDESFLSKLVWDGNAGEAFIMDDGVDPNDNRLLFNPVATLDKGTFRRVVRAAHLEHKMWHKSLWEAEMRKLSLTLTYKGFARDLKSEMVREMKEETGEIPRTVERVGLVEGHVARREVDWVRIDEDMREKGESDEGDEEEDEEDSDEGDNEGEEGEGSIADDPSETLAAESDHNPMDTTEG